MAGTPSTENDEAALGGTFTMDLTAGVLGVEDECVVWGLTLLMCYKEPSSRVASLAAHSVFCDMTVHGGQCTPSVFS